jgi:hypothetical protein
MDENPRLDQARADTERGYSGGRTASLTIELNEVDASARVSWSERWNAFPRESIPFVIALCDRLRDQFRTDAALIQLQLEGKSPPVPDRTVHTPVHTPDEKKAD